MINGTEMEFFVPDPPTVHEGLFGKIMVLSSTDGMGCQAGSTKRYLAISSYSEITVCAQDQNKAKIKTFYSNICSIFEYVHMFTKLSLTSFRYLSILTAVNHHLTTPCHGSNIFKSPTLSI